MSNYKTKSGFLLVDKPEGMPSFSLVKRIRKITKIKKIGHTGTLDPFASGLMIVCLGKATKLASKLITETKEYEVKMKLGIKTESGDLYTDVLKINDHPNITEADLKKIKPKIMAMNEQVPPQYSAVKYKGKPAYTYARKKEKIPLKPKPIKIYDLEFQKIDLPYIYYKTCVSKGTYIRVLTEDIAKELNTIAVTSALRRTKISNYDLSKATKLKSLQPNNWKKKLIDIADFMTDYPTIKIRKVYAFRHGSEIEVDAPDEEEVMVLNKGKCIGFGKIKNGVLFPQKVFI